MKKTKAKTQPSTQPAQRKKNPFTFPNWLNANTTMTLIIALAVFSCYSPVYRAGFIWDDDDFLTQNRLIKASDGIFKFWFSTEAPDYFPLTSSMLWVEWRLWGMEATGYHVVNVILHFISCILLGLVLLRLKIPGAWLAALICAVHPVNVESVAWITERKNTLPMVFYLASIFTFMNYIIGKNRRAYFMALFWFLLALFGKTSVSMLPVVLLGCLWWMNRKITRKDLISLAPFFALSFILSLTTIWFQYHRSIGVDVIRTDGFLSRLASAGCALWFYLYKALLPFNLSFIYPKWEVNVFSPLSYLPGLLVIAGMFFLWLRRGSWGRPFLFAFGYFVVTLFPVLGFFNIYFMKYSLVADHWQYLSLPGIIALVVGIGAHFYARTPGMLRDPFRLLCGLIVIALAVMTWRQSHIYINQEELWRDVIKKNPNAAIAYDNLGVGLTSMGRLDEAVGLHRKALEIGPNSVSTLNNLSVALSKLGRFEEADRYVQRALGLDSKSADSYNNWGLLLALQGKAQESVPHYQKALELNPNHVDAHNNLGNALARQQKYDQAITEFEKALSIYPDHPEAHYDLGLALAQTGKVDEAISHYLKAVEVRPNFSEAYNNLGVINEQKGDLKTAADYYSKAVRSDPKDVQARFNLALALTSIGQPKKAVEHYEFALRSEPNNDRIHDRYGDALSQMGRSSEALEHYRAALALNTNQPMLMAKIAVILATCEDSKIRNGAEAVRMAEQARDKRGVDDAIILDTLGMAYSEVGRFQDALAVGRKSFEIARSQGNEFLEGDIQERLKSYEAGKPFRFGPQNAASRP